MEKEGGRNEGMKPGRKGHGECAHVVSCHDSPLSSFVVIVGVLACAKERPWEPTEVVES
ncbi:hypothetical protein HCEG_00828 [Histoplasma capsulatum var. duboisii H88]|uniref:Uncharacterized protein n=1 Tax=Ajellomyces capsulatus (strain H88) TaxID=544711 RepID=F0U6D0_AJEC8|nr:hypothetical protein HCEG_00828 [Histoplasma capsulatum var. duboisii H88]